MRLETIKLAGFKSFVDPTTFHLQSNLTGIVGPNGCGKSNIVDAIRWVIGESSAKQLRGEAMVDVIFNGTNKRKPAGQASIELLFDNADARLGGEYAKFQEISIRRELNREGTSNYYLNGTRCRRRDVMDVFLGTGLGPRSYSIIEQGMISKLIEAKPEELRVYLEEAAGISKYKERRRETENRIRHTRENLERLNDLREEVDKQLKHLQQQARAAEKYKVYKEEQRLLSAQHHLLQIKSIADKLEQLTQQLQQDETKLEQQNAEHRHFDNQIETTREQLHDLREQFNQVQEQYFRAGAEISNVEQKIQYQQNLVQQYQQEQAQLATSTSNANEHLEQDNSQLLELTEDLATTEPNLALAAERSGKSQRQLADVEQNYQDLQEKWDQVNKETAEATQQAQVDQTRIQHLEHRITNLQNRIEKIVARFDREKLSVLAADVDVLQKQCQTLEASLQATAQRQQQFQSQIAQQRQAINETESFLKQTRDQVQELQRREAQLQALQQAELVQNDDLVIEWLDQQQINHQQRLAKLLKVNPGWEHAVELVLKPYLDAVCVDNLSQLTTAMTNLSGNLIAFDRQTPVPAQPGTLAEQVNCDWPINHLLNQVLIADTIDLAFAGRNSLATGQSIITKDGIWLGQHWLRIQRASVEKKGVINCERELQQIAQNLKQQLSQMAQFEQQLTEQKQQLQDIENERDAKQQEYRQLSQEFTQKSSHYNAQKARLDQVRTQELAGADELQECKQQQQEAELQLSNARESWQQALIASEQLIKQRDELQEVRNQARDQLQLVRELSAKDKQHLDELIIRVNSNKDKISYLQEAITRTTQQLEQYKQRREQLTEQLSAAQQPIPELKQQLETMLESRLAIENAFNQAREQVNQVEHQLRSYEQQRQQVQQLITDLRSGLEQIRIDQRTLQVHHENHQEQITAVGFDLQSLEKDLPDELTLDSCAEQLTKLENRIQRLGAINLAAIDEHTELATRKTYLDSQNDDLVEALTTLENAIHKIDRETRQRLRETYNQVNDTFQALFPKIFGGGQASLELLGDDLLSTGVLVRAQPPGKRNTTIHLLSGGEKALTAVALVFSLFQLNPAPFCILDEVDAPLDDNNAVRLANLIKEMSKQVQFLMISHNKISIETADQLCGITMHEPGVSRLVSVDIEEAMAMAES